MFEWEKNAHLYQSYKITSRCYINKKWLFCGNEEKNIRYALSGIAKEMFYSQKKASLCAVKKMRTFYFIHSKDRVNNFNSLHEFRIPDVALLLHKILYFNEIYLRHQKSTHSAQYFFGSFQFTSFWWPKKIPMFIENDVIRFDAMPFRWLKHLMRWL